MQLFRREIRLLNWRLKSVLVLAILVLGLSLLISGCRPEASEVEEATTAKAQDQVQDQGEAQGTDESLKPIRVQFSFSPRYAPDNSEPYAVVGEFAKIPIGFNVIMVSPGNTARKYRVLISPMGSDVVLEGVYETSEATYNKDFDEHTVMATDLKHLYTTYAETVTATCVVYDITEEEASSASEGTGGKVIFEGEAAVAGVEARKLEIAELNVGENVIDVAVTAYPDMKYEWRMNKDNEYALAPQSGDMGWNRESFGNDEDTEIAVTIYDERGRFNNFLYVYPKD